MAAVKLEVPKPEKVVRKPRSLMAKTFRPNAGPRKPRKKPTR